MTSRLALVFLIVFIGFSPAARRSRPTLRTPTTRKLGRRPAAGRRHDPPGTTARADRPLARAAEKHRGLPGPARSPASRRRVRIGRPVHRLRNREPAQVHQRQLEQRLARREARRWRHRLDLRQDRPPLPPASRNRGPMQLRLRAKPYASGALIAYVNGKTVGEARDRCERRLPRDRDPDPGRRLGRGENPVMLRVDENRARPRQVAIARRGLACPGSTGRGRARRCAFRRCGRRGRSGAVSRRGDV